MTNKMTPEMIQEKINSLTKTMTWETIAPAEEMIHGKESPETDQMKIKNLLEIQMDADVEMTHANAEMNAQENQKDFLIHYGVLGMKWGVRKQRPSSGSSRSSSKKKISSGKSRVKKALSNIKASSKKRKAAKEKAKRAKITDPKKMTDAELKKNIERLELEKKYKELDSATTSKGKKMLGEISSDIFKSSVKNIGGQLTTYLVGEGTNKLFRGYMKENGKFIYNKDGDIIGIEDIVNPRKGQKDKK